jgi:hypothetical protein
MAKLTLFIEVTPAVKKALEAHGSGSGDTVYLDDHLLALREAKSEFPLTFSMPHASFSCHKGIIDALRSVDCKTVKNCELSRSVYVKGRNFLLEFSPEPTFGHDDL